MWEDFIELASGPWQVGIRFDRASTAALVRTAFADDLIPPDPARPLAVGVRDRPGVGTTLFYGSVPLARVSDGDALIEMMSWFLAGLADAPRGIGSTTSLRALLGDRGAVLVSATRPTLLGAHAWREAGLVELPLLDVRVDAAGHALVLPSPPPHHLGRTAAWAGATVPVLGVVVHSVVGERRDDAVERLRAEVRGPFAQLLVDRLRESGRIRTGDSRSRLLRQALTLSA